jgi:hypothetical protein
MAFDLYLAGGARKDTQEKLHNRGCCKLYSQLTERSCIKNWINFNVEADIYHKLFIDSGAFTAWTKGVVLDVEDYINFINTYTEHLELFACVDNIPGRFDRTPTLEERKASPQLTWENYLYMRERVKDKDKLLPTFHLGEDLKALQNMLNTKLDGKHIPYIALGGTVGTPIPQKKKWYSTVFKVIKQSKNPNVKTHAFGMTSTDILEMYPFTSADSTSWKMTGVYGYILTEHGQIKVSDRASAEDNTLDKLTHKQQDDILGRLKELGVTYEQCLVDGDTRAYVNAMYQLDWADNYKYKGNNRYQKTLF